MTQPALNELVPAPESIALVDVSYLFKKRYHTIGITGVPMAAAAATVRDLEWLKEGVDHVILCRDAPPYSHRLAIDPEYKANRPVPEPEERAQRAWLYKEIRRLGFNIAYSEGYEADDVIATLAKKYAVWCEDVRIVGIDKDAAQCLGDNVKQYIPPVGDNDWVVRDREGVIKKWGVTPEQMPFYQALVGDSGDNIPGVKGIGPQRAAELVNKYQTIERLAEGAATEATAQGSKASATLKALAAGWDSLVMSLKLTTLDTQVPLDADALLIPREPEPAQAPTDSMGVALPPGVPEHPAMPAARKIYEERSAANQTDVRAILSKDAELLEQETDRERADNEEYEAREALERKEPAVTAQVVASPARPRPTTTALTTAPAYTQHSKYGIVSADLQPMDLASAYTVSEWIHNSGLYQAFKSPAAVFTIIARGKELNLGMTTALAGFHIVEGKPMPSADLLRALAERDPNFEYLMPVEMSATRVVWEGKHKRQPRPVTYTYTIEEARQAGLVRKTSYGKDSNWMLRPQDMLMKTAASKLARLLWPAATLGLYCIEEMGYAEHEIREAA